MDAILFYLGWIMVTSLIALISEEDKKETVWRYFFTFIIASIFYYFIYVRT
jgi:hypothetical protein